MNADLNGDAGESVTPELLTTKEAAARLRCSERTVFKLMRNGDLESIKLLGSRRIPDDAIAACIERLREQQRQRLVGA